MKRYYIELKDKAQKIYESLPRYKRADYVSEALVEKHEHEQGTSLQQQIDELTKRVERLERK